MLCIFYVLHTKKQIENWRERGGGGESGREGGRQTDRQKDIFIYKKKRETKRGKDISRGREGYK